MKILMKNDSMSYSFFLKDSRREDQIKNFISDFQNSFKNLENKLKKSKNL